MSESGGVKMELSDLDSDGPELSCQYIDGVIRRFPETKSTMEYIRRINSQLRYDANGYKEMYQELQSESQGLREEIERLKAAIIYAVDQLELYNFARDPQRVFNADSTLRNVIIVSKTGQSSAEVSGRLSRHETEALQSGGGENGT